MVPKSNISRYAIPTSYFHLLNGFNEKWAFIIPSREREKILIIINYVLIKTHLHLNHPVENQKTGTFNFKFKQKSKIY